MKTKVIKVDRNSIVFDDGTELYSDHQQDCCEHHYLNLADLSLKDFDGLKFDLSKENFFTRIAGYGISLNPVKGLPVRIAGHGDNNGYYSSELTLVLVKGSEKKTYDISKCQDY